MGGSRRSDSGQDERAREYRRARNGTWWVLAEVHTPEYRKRWLQLADHLLAAREQVVVYLRSICRSSDGIAVL